MATRAEALVERIAAVDYSTGAVERKTIEHAIAAHLAALGRSVRPFRWFDDVATALRYVSMRSPIADETGSAYRVASGVRDAASAAVQAVSWTAAWDAREDSDQAAIWARERGAAWTAVRDAAWFTAWEVSWPAARITVAMAQTRRELRAARARARSTPWSETHAAVLARTHSVWLPLVEAFEAGLFVYWVTEETICVPRPAMQLNGDRLHSGDGPAVAWPTGERHWFFRGIRVPELVITSPQTLTPTEVMREPNAEVRRVMMERFGFDRLLREGNARRVGEPDEYGALWRLDVPGDEPLCMVEVVNSTPEPDGSFKDYWLRVPPDVRSPREAIAWTFGIDDYAPTAQS